MDLVQHLMQTFACISRARRLECGLVIEVTQPNNGAPDWVQQTHQQLAEFAWAQGQEIIYALYPFRNNDERFALDGILRTQRSTQSGTISSSMLTALDVFGKFTRYDFDLLTLSNQDENTEVIFTVDPTSPSPRPIARFEELDLQGHQFPINSQAVVAGGHYAINAQAGLNFPF